MEYVWVGIGAAVGANGRYVLGRTVANWLGTAFPYGTLIINVTGSLLIGFLMVIFTERLLLTSNWRLLLVVGLLGGYTTFSSFSYESLNLMQQGRWLESGWYVLGSVGLSLLACYVGITLGHLVEG